MPHAPANHQQSWMPGSALALAKPEARFYDKLQLGRDLFDRIDLNGISRLHVIEVLNTDPALKTRLPFPSVVLEAL